jgi:hypothetical protein
MKGGEVFLIIGILVLLILMMNPSLVGTTAGSIVGDTFTNVWLGFGGFGQSAVLLIAFIVAVAFLINKK